MTLKVAPAACASSVPAVAMAPWYFCRQKPNNQSPPGRRPLLPLRAWWRQLLPSLGRAALATPWAAEKGPQLPSELLPSRPCRLLKKRQTVSEITLPAARRSSPQLPPILGVREDRGQVLSASLQGLWFVTRGRCSSSKQHPLSILARWSKELEATSPPQVYPEPGAQAWYARCMGGVVESV